MYDEFGNEIDSDTGRPVEEIRKRWESIESSQHRSVSAEDVKKNARLFRNKKIS